MGTAGRMVSPTAESVLASNLGFGGGGQSAGNTKEEAEHKLGYSFHICKVLIISQLFSRCVRWLAVHRNRSQCRGIDVKFIARSGILPYGLPGNVVERNAKRLGSA